MSDVVLRCPTCGTTQNQPGECDACYEGQVRYFCNSHSPGLWLDEPQCKACGAKFGETRRKDSTPATATARPVPARTAPGRAPSPGAPPRESPLPKPSAGKPTRASPGRTREPIVTPDAPPYLTDILARLLGARRERTDYKVEKESWGDPIPQVPLRPLKGCLGRFIVFLLLLFVLVVAGSFFLVGGALQFILGNLMPPTELTSSTLSTVHAAIAAVHSFLALPGIDLVLSGLVL